LPSWWILVLWHVVERWYQLRPPDECSERDRVVGTAIDGGGAPDGGTRGHSRSTTVRREL
jgi:hypothetical protein